MQHWQLTSPYTSQTAFPFLVGQLALSALSCPHPWICLRAVVVISR